jgi:hypothetical protein
MLVDVAARIETRLPERVELGRLVGDGFADWVSELRL